MTNASFAPLPRAEVIKAVEGRGPSRVPIVKAHWWGEGLRDQYGDRLDALNRYPEDAVFIGLPRFKPSAMGLSWELPQAGGHDNRPVLDDWAKLDEFIEKLQPLPDPSDPALDKAIRQAEDVRRRDTYLIVGWWRLFFETPWELRGMENLMLDYYENPELVHRLHAALCDHYCRLIDFAAGNMRPDGFWTSDDLGHQTQPMMAPPMFDEFLKPCYDRIGRTLRAHRIHWWLHSCGNNTPLLPALLDAGVQMFHPVQKHTMNEQQVVRDFGGRLGFWAGFDVQHALREGTPDDVRKEVRFLIDTFDRPDGRLCLAAGNGIVAGTPLANIEAFLDEAVTYGSIHRQDAEPAKRPPSDHQHT